MNEGSQKPQADRFSPHRTVSDPKIGPAFHGHFWVMAMTLVYARYTCIPTHVVVSVIFF
jgi:hypothetical protein